jgi:hypothetical protein
MLGIYTAIAVVGVDVSVNYANGLQLYNTSLAGVTIDAPANVVTYVPQSVAA